MQVVHRYENGKLVHDVLVSVKVIEKEPEKVQKGPLEETDLSKLKVPTIVWIPKFLRVSGSQIYAKDRKPDDIDVIACGEEDDKDRIVVPLDKPLRLKIDRFLEKRFGLKGETSWHGTPYGANWKNLPIFDLALIPRNPLKFEEMNESEFAAEFYKSKENVETEVTEKATGEEAKKMADVSKKEDKIEVGIHGIVWKKIETKTPNVWNYDYALSFTAQDKIDPKFVVEVKGKEFTNVGRSLNTAVDVPVGGIITIRFHTINLYTDAKTGLKHIGVYEPRFYEYRKGDVSPDSFSSAIKIGRDSGLLIEKAMFVGIEFLRKGEALLVDEEFDVVEIAKEDAEFLSKIENTNFRIVKNEKRFLLKQDPYLHLPPEDKQYRYGIQHHFRKKSVHADDRSETE